MVLFFQGKNEDRMELSMANFSILENYETINFYPIIPIVIYIIFVFLTICLFYYMFLYEKNSKNKNKIYRELFEQ